MAAEEVKFVFDMDDKFSDKAKQAERNAGGLERSLEGIGRAAVTAFSVGAIVNFTKSIVESYGEMEAFKVALTTMLRGNRAEAEALNSQLIELAKTTPFSLTDVQQGSRQLLAYGFEAGQLTTTMRTLGDVSAGVGSNLTDIAYLYGTLKTQDKVLSKDLYQFANRGIPILETLAKRFKTTSSAIFDLASEGKIHFKDIEWAFAQMTGKGGQFFNLMEEQSKTVKGQLSNLADSWDQLKVAIGESQDGIIKSTLSWATRLVSDITEIEQATNRLQSGLRKGGAQEFGWMDRNSPFGDKDQYLAMMNQREGFHDAITKGANDEAALRRILAQTATGITRLINNRNREQQDIGYSDGLSDKDFNRLVASLKDVQTETRGAIDLLKSKKKGETDKGTGIDNESNKTQKPQYTQINITIEKMAGIEKVENVTEQQAAILTAEQITKFMVKAVEDAQIIAGK